MHMTHKFLLMLNEYIKEISSLPVKNKFSIIHVMLKLKKKTKKKKKMGEKSSTMVYSVQIQLQRQGD